MDEIEANATTYKVGKRVGRGAKVKNATKVTYKGIEFDSKLELNCYIELEESGLEFVFKPEKVILCPGFVATVLDHSPSVKKKMNREIRFFSPDKEAIKTMDKHTAALYRKECRADQSRVKREYNIKYNKVFVEKKILPVTWSPDFYLPDHNIYIESKGFANDSFPIKFKLARWMFGLGIEFKEKDVFMEAYKHRKAIEVGSKKEMQDTIKFIRSL
jgi:hypothetical protein